MKLEWKEPLPRQPSDYLNCLFFKTLDMIELDAAVCLGVVQRLVIFYSFGIVSVPCSSPFLNGFQLLVLFLLPTDILRYGFIFSKSQTVTLEVPLFSCPSFAAFYSVSHLLYSGVFRPSPGLPLSPGFPHIPAFPAHPCPFIALNLTAFKRIFGGFFSDFLLSRIESLPGVVDDLNSTFTSYHKDQKGGA